MTDSFTHETSVSVCDPEGSVIGDIDVRITYVVTSHGSPARVHYDELDHPAEPAEVDVVHVEMLNAPKSGSKATYIDAWDWLFDWAGDWCAEHAEELAACARLKVEGQRDAADDTRYRERRLEVPG